MVRVIDAVVDGLVERQWTLAELAVRAQIEPRLLRSATLGFLQLTPEEAERVAGVLGVPVGRVLNCGGSREADEVRQILNLEA